MAATGFKPTGLNGSMASLAKWLSVRLRTKCLRVLIALLPLKTSYIGPVASKEFLDIQTAI